MAASLTPDVFVRQATVETPVALVPGLRLLLASDAHGIFEAAEALPLPPGRVRLQPYWAFAWPGGQGLARYLLDHPELVVGRRVLDVGAGSGIASIAAMQAGAASVLAADIDRCAEIAIRLNAGLNDVAVAVTTADVLGELPDCDVVLIADLVYEPELATRVAGFLAALSAAGRTVVLADRTSARRPPLDFELVAEYGAPLTPALEDLHFERARVWRLKPGTPGAGHRRRAAAQRGTDGA